MPGAESIVMEKWKRARGSSFGRWLFSRGVGRFAPYTRTIGARVEVLEHEGILPLRRALIASLPPNTRMIPVRLETDFTKKGRGLMTAEASCIIPSSNEKAELPATVVIRDDAGDEVARGRVTVVIGPSD